jgi:two-component system heavy metal sensor histidine kinase CusS
LSNLLQNAIQHSSAGAPIQVRIERREGSVRLAVSNCGEPIAEAYLPRLFDRFYRVDAARSDTSGHCGHGLGLAIVKAVAEMHGGEVFASSAGGLTTIAFSVAGTRSA